MNRRGFLKTCLALAAAPAIVRAESLMKIWVPPQELVLPQSTATLELWGAQIEQSMFHEGEYEASVFVRKPGGVWERMFAHTNGMPVMRITPQGEVTVNGMSMQVGHGPINAGVPVGDNECAKLSGRPGAYIELGDPKGMKLSQAHLSLTAPGFVPPGHHISAPLCGPRPLDTLILPDSKPLSDWSHAIHDLST